MDQEQEEKVVWPVGKKTAMFTVSIVFLLALFDIIDRQILASLLPYIRDEWNLTDLEVGSLVGIINISIALLVVPCGYLVDKWSRKKMLALMGLVWGFASLACAFAGNFAHLLIARFAVGAGESGYNPAASALLTAQFPKKHRSKALAIVQLALTMGTPLGLFFGGWLGATVGWRHAFGIVAIPGILVALLAFLIKDYKTVDISKDTGKKTATVKAPVETKPVAAAPAPAPQKKVTYISTIVALAGMPTFWLIILASIVFQMVGASATAWRPMYFVRVAQFTPATAATISAGLMLTVLVSTAIAGPAIDYMRKKFLSGAAIITFIVLICQAAMAMTAYSGIVAPGSIGQCALFLISGCFGGFATVAGMTIITDLVHPGIRASALSLQVFAQNFFGMAVGPVLIGWMSMTFGSLQTSLFIVGSLNLVVAFLYILVAFITYKRDIVRKTDMKIEF